MADPGFSRGSAPTPKSAIIFHFFLPKTAWKWKNLDPHGGGASLAPPFWSASVGFHSHPAKVKSFPKGKSILSMNIQTKFTSHWVWKAFPKWNRFCFHSVWVGTWTDIVYVHVWQLTFNTMQPISFDCFGTTFRTSLKFDPVIQTCESGNYSLASQRLVLNRDLHKCTYMPLAMYISVGMLNCIQEQVLLISQLTAQLHCQSLHHCTPLQLHNNAAALTSSLHHHHYIRSCQTSLRMLLKLMPNC